MVYRTLFALLCLIAVASFSPVYADPAAAPAAEPVAAPTAPTGKPLLIIRFNQRRVYFDRALRQAVTAAERAKHDVYYDIVSYVPAGANQARTDDASQQADGNLASVVQQMVGMGVDGSRIRSLNMNAPAGMTTQEVHIFVR